MQKINNINIVIFDMDDIKNPHWGSGQAIATRQIFKKLSKNNRITVYCSKYPGWLDYIEDNISYKHLGLSSNFPLVNNIAFIISMILRIRHIKSDIIMENFTAPFSVSFLPIFTKIPVIGISSFFDSETLGNKYGLPFHKVQRFGARFYRYFIALNHGHEKLMNSFNNKILTKVIPNGLDSKYLKYPVSEKKYILYIGRIDIFQKGLDLLLEAFSIIAKDINEKLVIAGTGNNNELNKLKSLISKYNLSKNVILIGKVSGTKKIKVMSNAKLIVIPSRYEGQSLVALESISLGKVIITFNIDGFNWIDEKSSYKINGYNSTDLSIGIKELLSDYRKRKHIGSNARKYAKKYDWNITSKEYINFINKVLNIEKVK